MRLLAWRYPRSSTIDLYPPCSPMGNVSLETARWKSPLCCPARSEAWWGSITPPAPETVCQSCGWPRSGRSAQRRRWRSNRRGPWWRWRWSQQPRRTTPCYCWTCWAWWAGIWPSRGEPPRPGRAEYRWPWRRPTPVQCAGAFASAETPSPSWGCGRCWRPRCWGRMQVLTIRAKRWTATRTVVQALKAMRRAGGYG